MLHTTDVSQGNSADGDSKFSLSPKVEEKSNSQLEIINSLQKKELTPGLPDTELKDRNLTTGKKVVSGLFGRGPTLDMTNGRSSKS